MPFKKKPVKALVAIFVFVAVTLMTAVLPSLNRIREPFDMHFGGEWDFIHTAKLVQQHGFSGTHFLSVWESGIIGEKFTFYTHYPPLASWLYSAAAKIFDFQYLYQYRLVNVVMQAVFVLLLLLFTYHLGGKMWISIFTLVFMLSWRYFKPIFSSTSIFTVSFVALLILWFLYIKFWQNTNLNGLKKWLVVGGITTANFVMCFSQFDFWPFFITLTFLQLVLILLFKKNKTLVKKSFLLIGTALFSLFLAIGLRLAINYQYFGSWQKVFSDLSTAADKRSLDCSVQQEQMSDENRLNYGGINQCNKSRLVLLLEENKTNLKLYWPHLYTYYGYTPLIALFCVPILFRLIRKKTPPYSPEAASLLFAGSAIPFIVLLPVMFRQGFAVTPFFMGFLSLFFCLLVLIDAKLNKFGFYKYAEVIILFFLLALLFKSERLPIVVGAKNNPTEVDFAKKFELFCEPLPHPLTIIYTSFQNRYLNFICIDDNVQFMYQTYPQICRTITEEKNKYVILNKDEQCPGFSPLEINLPYNVFIHKRTESLY